jgi:hypothetical protein
MQRGWLVYAEVRAAPVRWRVTIVDVRSRTLSGAFFIIVCRVMRCACLAMDPPHVCHADSSSGAAPLKIDVRSVYGQRTQRYAFWTIYMLCSARYPHGR